MDPKLRFIKARKIQCWWRMIIVRRHFLHYLCWWETLETIKGMPGRGINYFKAMAEFDK